MVPGREYIFMPLEAAKGRNTYNRNFLKFLSSVLNDDSLILKDEERLREVIKKDIKILCNTGKSK